jgi:UDP-glucose-4-epimerase GalE
LADFGAAYALRSVILRYFNAAGADAEVEIGEAHDPETHLIPLVLDAVSGKRPDVTIFGGDYDTKDGTCIRDYIHVSDLADAHVRALQSLESGSVSSVYNLGNGNGFSVREVLNVVERLVGVSVPVVLGSRRAGDPAVLVSDASKAKAALRWTPAFPSLDEIVRSAWEWHQKAGKFTLSMNERGLA